MKLFVLVRKDLSKNQQAVQAGHVVAQYLLHVQNHSWTNGTLIYLGVDNKEELEIWGDKLDMQGLNWVGFKEPDLNNEMTALSIASDENPFKRLKLMEL